MKRQTKFVMTDLKRGKDRVNRRIERERGEMIKRGNPQRKERVV